MNLSWRSGRPYDVIRSDREAYVRHAIAVIRENEGAVQVPGFSDYYVTPSGTVYSTSGRKITRLRPGTKPGGYKFVGLTSDAGDRKYEMVHRLVAKAFISNPEGLPAVNHKDLDKSNNTVENLEWVSHSQNSNHAIEFGAVKLGQGTRRLCSGQIKEVVMAAGRYRDIGAKYGISAQTVCNIKRGFNRNGLAQQAMKEME